MDDLLSYMTKRGSSLDTVGHYLDKLEILFQKFYLDMQKIANEGMPAGLDFLELSIKVGLMRKEIKEMSDKEIENWGVKSCTPT